MILKDQVHKNTKSIIIQKIISRYVSRCVVWATSSLRSEEKASPSVLCETVKLNVDFVEEKVFCRAVSFLVVTVDLKVMQSILKEKNIYLVKTLLKK